jgi:RNA polymerase sigma-70 factor, ECF subfamily
MMMSTLPSTSTEPEHAAQEARPPSSGAVHGPLPQPADPASAEAEIAQALEEQQWRAATLVCARHYGRDVGRLCLAMLGDHALADEAAQDALLSAHQAWPSYRAEAPARAWLLGIARKKCLRAREQQRQQQRHLTLVEQPRDVENAEEWLARKTRAERARTALAAMRPTEREALLLRYHSELSYEAIASACAVDTAAARKRVSRGLLRLRALLQQHDDSSKNGDAT